MLVLEVGLVKGPEWGINIEVAVKGGGKVEVGIRAGIGIGAGERVMEWLNSMAMIAMVEVLARGRCWGEG